MKMQKLLVANRGEIAIRIMRAAAELGLKSATVFSQDDARSLHTIKADHALPMEGKGAAAYLDIEQIVTLAKEAGCDALHPGYGFLSENAAFAARCREEGIAFVGPRVELLNLFGDKVQARALALRCGVPLLPGTPGPTTLSEAKNFLTFLGEGGAMMIKAVSGGGGRGMRAVHRPEEVEEAYAVCQSEAKAAFGNGDVYVEKLISRARHIEVQVLGDGSGAVTHLGERECTLQRRNQKLVEIAPSPWLRPETRERIVAAALRMAEEVKYEGLGTFEFLVDGSSGDDFAFMEVNPRLQVEHTVTEEVTGIDLVKTQLRLASGHSLADLGLDRASAPAPRGFALQVRINMETMSADGTTRPGGGTLTAFDLPSGPGLRVDTFGYPGYTTSPSFDSLLAKVIGYSNSPKVEDVVAKTYRALCEFNVQGVPTNIEFLQNLLQHGDFREDRVYTRFIEDRIADLVTPQSSSHQRLFFARSAGSAEPEKEQKREVEGPKGSVPVRAPWPGTIVSVDVADGEAVAAGDQLLVMEAMKMQQVITASCSGMVRMVAVASGDSVFEGTPLVFLDEAAVASAKEGKEKAASQRKAAIDSWEPEIEELKMRERLAEEMGGADKVARQHHFGKLTIRERIEGLVDRGSFHEVGKIAGVGTYGENGKITAFTPANSVFGTGEIDERPVIISGDDFTVRAGSADASIKEKRTMPESLALELRLPHVRLLDGMGGGGSVKTIEMVGRTYIPIVPGWEKTVEHLAVAPSVSLALGSVAGLGAARVATSHYSVIVKDTAQMMVAGPALVAWASLGTVAKEELGASKIHTRNGAIDDEASSEAEAFAMARKFLSYLPSNVDELPPVTQSADDPGRTDERLISIIPRDAWRAYDMREIISSVVDLGSFFEIGRHWGSVITGLARLGGVPVAIFAEDPTLYGGAWTSDGSRKLVRFADLASTFHLPLIHLVDCPGFLIGKQAEEEATIRFGSQALAALGQITVPFCSVIIRKAFGVAGCANKKPGSQHFRFAWPSGDWGSLPIEGGIEAAYKAELEAAEDYDAHLAKIKDRLNKVRSPFRTADIFGIEEIIDPRKTRPTLCYWAKLVRKTQRPLPTNFGYRP